MMKKIIILITLFYLFVHPLEVLSQNIPHNITYQGYLTYQDGSPVDGNLSVTFRIYNDPSNPSFLWEETQSVHIHNGIYNVTLGIVNPVNLPFDEQYYVGVQINSDPEMLPRIRLASVPYCFKAEQVDNLQNVGFAVIDSLQVNDTLTIGNGMTEDPAIMFDGLSNKGKIIYDDSDDMIELNKLMVRQNIAIDRVKPPDPTEWTVSLGNCSTSLNNGSYYYFLEYLTADGSSTGTGLNLQHSINITDNNTQCPVLTLPHPANPRIDTIRIHRADTSFKPLSNSYRLIDLPVGTDFFFDTGYYLQKSFPSQVINETGGQFLLDGESLFHLISDDGMSIGKEAGLNNHSYGNTYIGIKAGKGVYNSTGDSNTVIGHHSFSFYTSGSDNTIVGAFAAQNITSGGSNNAVGSGALASLTTGYENDVMGMGVLNQLTTGARNVVIGSHSMFFNSNGINNTVLGTRAGYNNTGSGNIFIGYNAGYNETGSNKLYIDNSNTSHPLIYGDFSANVLTINNILRLHPESAAPQICNGSTEGAIYYDSDINKLCFCDGSLWSAIDNSTVCN
jgi:hypothetical protein